MDSLSPISAGHPASATKTEPFFQGGFVDLATNVPLDCLPGALWGRELQSLCNPYLRRDEWRIRDDSIDPTGTFASLVPIIGPE